MQSDLEAMRGKVLLEIMEKNKLKEELKEIKKQQGIELAVQQKRI